MRAVTRNVLGIAAACGLSLGLSSAPASKFAGHGKGTAAPGVGARLANGASIVMDDVNPGANFDRDQCLTIALGVASAAECGDLRIVHELPTTTTYGRARTPTLLYNSRFADPHQLIAANVYIPPGSPALTQVEAVLTVEGSPRARGVWKGAAWPASGNGRIALAFDASTDSTGIYRYRLDVTTKRGTVSETQHTNGTFATVNRKSSPFGAGWWLAGLEKLVLDPSQNPSMWVGGDGSVRRYRKISDTSWVAPSIDRPDSLRRSGSGFVRLVSGGTRVIFDSVGRHVITRNRLNRQTTFAYGAGNRLLTITVPGVDTTGQPGKRYTFSYALNGALLQVDAPCGCALPGGLPQLWPQPRVTRFVVNGGRIESIQDPLTRAETFAYLRPGSTRILSRKDPNGFSARFQFDGAGNVSKYVQERIGGDSSITLLTFAESLGLPAADGTGAIDATLARTFLDGPRTDVADTTAFWVDRFGSPTRIHDALGHETVLTRGNSVFPGLVTEVTDANGFVTRATYDSRGNISSSTLVSPYGDGRDATTQYLWDQKWDSPVRITLPQGEVTSFAYDTLTGNRLFQQPGPDSARRVRFTYNSDGLLSTAREPGSTAPDSVAYDVNGNVRLSVSPTGVRRETFSDVVGRVIRTLIPVDSLQTLFQTEDIQYDALGRVINSYQEGPALNGADAKGLTLLTSYDLSGDAYQIERRAAPDAAYTYGRVTRYTYDEEHRRISETQPDYTVDSTIFDPAGNATKVRTRRTDPVSGVRLDIVMEYDPLNRLRRKILPAVDYPSRREGVPTRIKAGFFSDGRASYPITRPAEGLVPADTAVFDYEAMGRMTVANNRYAHVRRTYYPGGQLRTDTLEIRTNAPITAGGRFDLHRYGLGYSYDLDGRRVQLVHPSQIAPVVGGVTKDRTLFAYDTVVTGNLARVTDPLGNEYRFHYDLRSRLDSLIRPGGIAESFVYDQIDRVTNNVVTSASTSPDAGGPTLRSAIYKYEIRDKLVSTSNSVGPMDQLTARYDGLGMVYSGSSQSSGYTYIGQPANSYSSEAIVHDGMGNQMHVDASSGWRTAYESQASSGPTDYKYDQTMGRLVSVISGNPRDTLYYDGAGNEIFHSQWPSNQSTHDRASWYTADGMLRASESRSVSGEEFTFYKRAFEEYRYDALGRRVWLRSLRDCEGDPAGADEECYMSKIRRTVWDGNEELYEIQMPGEEGSPYLETDTNLPQIPLNTNSPIHVDQNPYFGRVAYTSGLSTDQPLGVVRMNYGDQINDAGNPTTYRSLEPFAISPLWNERGQPADGVFDDGGIRKCDHTVTPIRCVYISWVQTWFAYKRPEYRPGFWHGTLLEDKQDHVGTHYRRNRNYDPQTGRFTQEDPIGLGGGANLYGFAAGDPVNFGDPFGLKISFTGPRERELRSAWNMAKAILRNASEGGDKIATFALRMITRAEASSVTFTFRSGRAGSGGVTTVESGYREMIIDEGYVDKNPTTARDYLIMLHEFGHASAWNILHNGDQSYPQALAFENAGRRAMGFTFRPDHEGTPPELERKK